MTGQEAIAYIESFGWEKRPPGLHRIRELLYRLGDPHKQLKFIHAAGTNGKGGTCACIASILEAAGYRVGLNTSPHLETFYERIRVNGKLISDEDLGALTERVRAAAEGMDEGPTEFELITAVAFLYFLKERCQIVVLETGLGGELDASNVIDTPELAVLTAMGMDHAAILGPTQTDIAAAKAGIIKPGGSVVSFGGCPEADAVFRRICRERGASLTKADFSRLSHVRPSLTGTMFDFAPWKDLSIPLAGNYQVKNAALALTAAEILQTKGWNISDDALRQGLAAVRWPGRFELLRQRPAVVMDGAHNAHGMRAAVESLQMLFPGKKWVFLLGILADKDVEKMLDLLAPLAGAAVVLQPDSPRALPSKRLCELLEERGVPSWPAASAKEAVAVALAAAGESGMVCALGSLYLCGELRPLLRA